jgi:two-component system response regulator RpaA
MTASLLVIEDDQIVVHTIERILRKDFRVRVASSGVEGLQAARREIPDLVILDVIMPGMDGYTVCKEMRQDVLLSEIPILFLTAKTRDEDKIAGLSAGADDYLGKPFNIEELMLRVRAILRRTQRMRSHYGGEQTPLPAPSVVQVKSDAGQLIVVGEYSLNTRTFEFSGPGINRFRLTPVQYDLLYHLMTHPGEIFSPVRLLDEVWDYPSDAGSPDLVRVHIKNLREKTEQDPRNPKFILTVPGFGYTIQLPR